VTAGSSQEIEQFIRSVARSTQSALLLDYDGTLAPFSIDRDKALPYPGVISILQEIVETGRTRFVIITGRDAHNVIPLLGIHPAPEVWGCHGLQRLRPDGSFEQPELSACSAQALQDAERWLTYQGLDSMVESKPGSIAMHWRGLEENDAVELRGKVLLGWFPIADRGALAVFEFDGGIELRIADRDKSDAIRTILLEIGPDCPVAYLGDDLTDERAFRAMGARGLTVLVRPERRSTAARFWLRPPDELLDFLSRWRDACQTTTLARTAT
jgi:trehalose 6-phosphate phosphatase